MTYQEYITNNKNIAKKYPGVGSAFTESTEKNIAQIKTHFVKSGSRWFFQNEEKEDVDYEHYVNVVTAIPFFRNLGGKEIVRCSYTNRAYLPTEIHSISPDGREKYVYRFIFN